MHIPSCLFAFLAMVALLQAPQFVHTASSHSVRSRCRSQVTERAATDHTTQVIASQLGNRSHLCIACLIPSSRSLGGLYDIARSTSCCSSVDIAAAEFLGLGSSLNLGSLGLLKLSDRNDEFRLDKRRPSALPLLELICCENVLRRGEVVSCNANVKGWPIRVCVSHQREHVLWTACAMVR